MNVLDEVGELLRERIGLEVESVGVSAIKLAVNRRLEKSKLSRLEEYWEKLQREEGERQELVEEIVVKETWFFRDREPFKALAAWVRSDWLPQHRSGVLRILSVPAATGEEPYSIAMTLLEAGLAPAQFRIEGVDISARAITQAKEGIYRKNSFRGDDLGFRDRHFESGVVYTLKPAARESVRFGLANLAGPVFLPQSEGFDVIFCRNLLIYFHDEAKAQAEGHLKRLLKPGGILFLGHSEAGFAAKGQFEVSGSIQSFAYRKASAVPPKTARTINRPPKVSVKRPPSESTPAAQPRQPVVPPAKPNSPGVSQREWLATAEVLANQGKFSEALALCERALHGDKDSAEAHFLLGLIHDGKGQEMRAMELYKKAIYLKADYEEAMTHLSLLLERKGDLRAAGQWRVRAGGVRNRVA